MITAVSLPPELGLSAGELGWVFEQMLNVQAAANAKYFQAHPDAPCCLDCGTIRYVEPPLSDRQTFASAPDILRTGTTGCAGAAAYEAGLALSKGTAARVSVEWVAPGDYHAVVIYPDGRRSDPSAELTR